MAALSFVLASGAHCASAEPDDAVAFDARALVAEETLVGADGSRFATGIFSGLLRSGDSILVSRGATDVFVTRADSGGRVVWARGVGSDAAETDPHVSIDEGALTLVAMTRGAVDCGGGPMRLFDGEAFVVCSFDASSGAFLSGGSFPTGRR